MATTINVSKRISLKKIAYLTFASISAVAWNCLLPANLAAETQQEILVDAMPNGYRLRYQDPDFDNEWREYLVELADRLLVETRTTVISYDRERWLYTYDVANNADSQQSVVSFALQAAYGSEAFSPIGWEVFRNGHSSFSWTTVQPSGIAPAASGSGWSLVSDNLPVVREAQVRGGLEGNVAFLDMPEKVRQRVSELEKHNTIRIAVLAPGIATRIITFGQEGERKAQDILAETLERYPEWLRDAAAAADSSGMRRPHTADQSNVAWVERLCKQLSDGSLVLRTNQSAARTYFANIVRDLDKVEPEDQWLKQLRQALNLILRYVLSRL